jgi:hypothetical protein
MAYESQLIASMNNPHAVARWRREQAVLWEARAQSSARTVDSLSRKLEAAREENIALHKDLAEAYESIRIRDMNFLDDVAKYADEAVYWKQRATERDIGFFVFVSILLVSVWVDLLTRLS